MLPTHISQVCDTVSCPLRIGGKGGRSVGLTTLVYLLLWLRMRGALSPRCVAILVAVCELVMCRLFLLRGMLGVTVVADFKVI